MLHKRNKSIPVTQLTSPVDRDLIIFTKQKDFDFVKRKILFMETKHKLQSNIFFAWAVYGIAVSQSPVNHRI